MTGSIFEAPDALSLAESQLHFHFGKHLGGEQGRQRRRFS